MQYLCSEILTIERIFVEVKHRGEIVEKAVRETGYSITRLAAKLGKSRRWMYYAFENPALSLDTIYEIGSIIRYDFAHDLNQLRKSINAVGEAEEPVAQYSEKNTAEYWKDRYLNILEKYNDLLANQKTKKFHRKRRVSLRKKKKPAKNNLGNC